MVEKDKHPLTSTQKYISFPDLSNRDDVANEVRKGTRFSFKVIGFIFLVIGLVMTYILLNSMSSESSQAPGRDGIELNRAYEDRGGVVRYFIVDENGVMYIIEDNIGFMPEQRLDNSLGAGDESSPVGNGVIGCEAGYPEPLTEEV